jgi:hypothetical protein
MKFKINKQDLGRNLRDALRRAGYFGIEDRRSGRSSYVRRLSRSQHYPRFHLYIDEEADFYFFNLHLDQKQVSYQGARAHSADYDEPAVEEEAKRISSIINNL